MARTEKKWRCVMKRIISAIICLLLVAGMVPAFAAGVSDVMCVYNCSEWVSLRESPDTSSARLVKVRLGELVTDCSAAPNDFIQCEFNGKVGYIQSKYLKTTNFSSGEAFPGNQMVVNCSEWVSLWDQPLASAKRLAKVPLGSIVTACVSYMGSYVYCEYKGQKGYISTAYLKNANYSAGRQDEKVVSSHAGDYPPITGPMVVVNCNEWVSLREKASASAARLARVPLGASVENCVQVSDTFIYCSYRGVWGYIGVNYLSEPEGNEPEGTDGAGTAFSALPYLPGYAAFAAVGTEIFSETRQGYTIMARRAYGELEEIMAVCYDAQGRPLWQIQDKSLWEPTNVMETDAFLAGTAENPQLIWFVNGKGFRAFKVGPQLEEIWTLPESDKLNINDTICHGVDTDGTIYAAFADSLCSISPEGQLRWVICCDKPDLYHPGYVVVGDEFVQVYYDNHPEDYNMAGLAYFSRDGFLLMITQTEWPDFWS